MEHITKLTARSHWGRSSASRLSADRPCRTCRDRCLALAGHDVRLQKGERARTIEHLGVTSQWSREQSTQVGELDFYRYAPLPLLENGTDSGSKNLVDENR